MSKLRTLRSQAFQAQHGKCYYCGCQMWTPSPNDPRPKRRLNARFRCTAEHLVARQDGGKGVRTNIVAACLFCNSNRHKAKRPLAPHAYRVRVQRRIAKAKWNAKISP